MRPPDPTMRTDHGVWVLRVLEMLQHSSDVTPERDVAFIAGVKHTLEWAAENGDHVHDALDDVVPLWQPYEDRAVVEDLLDEEQEGTDDPSKEGA